jgi:hypothetical protein
MSIILWPRAWFATFTSFSFRSDSFFIWFHFPVRGTGRRNCRNSITSGLAYLSCNPGVLPVFLQFCVLVLVLTLATLGESWRAPRPSIFLYMLVLMLTVSKSSRRCPRLLGLMRGFRLLHILSLPRLPKLIQNILPDLKRPVMTRLMHNRTNLSLLLLIPIIKHLPHTTGYILL